MLKLTHRKLQNLPRESIHKARNWSKADVSVAEWPPKSGNRVVIKELTDRPLWYRALVGRYLLRREWRALCALRDLEGVPAPIARPNSDTIVMELRPGKPLDKVRWWKAPENIVPKIESLLRTVHARGITHGDLHSYNVLVDENGVVTLIDWATAGVFKKKRSGVKSLTFAEWQALDERALAKIKIVYAPTEITAEQHDLLLHGGSKIYQSVKKLRTFLERLRGVDKINAAKQERKRLKTLKRLQTYAPDQGEAEIIRIKAEREEKRQQKLAAAKKQDAVLEKQ